MTVSIAGAPRRIFLTGLMASGKSTVAPLLAARLGWDWVDLDELIAQRTGQTIAQLFSVSEAAFRSAETAALAELAATPPGVAGQIVATGGGAIGSEVNRELMRGVGKLVALEVTPEVALSRAMAPGQPERPLLHGDALAQLRALHAARAPLYATADLRVATDNLAPGAVTDRIIAGLVARGGLPLVAEDSQIIPVAIPAAPHTITIAWGGLSRLPAVLDDLHLPLRLTIVTDAQIRPLYLDGVCEVLRMAGYDVGISIIPAGETAKTLQTVQNVYDDLLGRRAERGEAIIALGGGVVGDLAGFAAATYLRGVPVIQLPTTLLAQVDSAIGGKTGVNHPRAKNIIGAFYQPRAILIDPATLLTLSDRLLREGLGEVVKYGVILDGDLFADLEAHHADLLRRDPQWLAAIITRCAAIKAGVVAADEREAGQRLLLNYGHTIGHALEALAGYGTLLHGEAVFLGMAVEARIARRLGLIDAAAVARQDALALACGAPTQLPADLTPAMVLAATRLDKKAQGGRVRWALPDGPGHGVAVDVPDEVALAAIADVLGGV